MTARGGSAPRTRLSRLEQLFPRAWQFALARLTPRKYLGLHLTIGLALSALLLWGFVSIAEELPEKGGLVRLDLAVDAWLQSHGTEGGESIFRAVSWLGAPVLISIAVIVTLYLLYRRDWLSLLVWSSTVGGGAVLNWVLKTSFRRERPANASEFIKSASWSFPSGHAMGAMILYGLLAYMAFRRTKNLTLRRTIVIGAALLIGAIGFSRLYLGVHYVSDVIAGFLAGGLWLTICISAFDIVRRRAGQDEPGQPSKI
jgi:membrane-associated phospholipid phosphatase